MLSLDIFDYYSIIVDVNLELRGFTKNKEFLITTSGGERVGLIL